MPSVVVYMGHAPAVEGGGFVFPHGEPVTVPDGLAGTLGPDFMVMPSAEEEDED